MENRKVRLIDANVLKEKLLDEFNQSGAYTSYKYAIGEALDYLNEQPTIDPASLRPHGEWIWDEENECWVCSNCESSALNNYRGNSTDSNYCPNCGAVMQGVKDE